MKKSFVLLIALAVIVPLAVSSCASEQPALSGIRGKVLIGPVAPVQKEGEPNDKPYPDALILITDASGKRKITSAVTDKDGMFAVNLSPGTYQVLPQTPRGQILPVGSPQTVTVEKDRFTDIIVYYDSGIR